MKYIRRHFWKDLFKVKYSENDHFRFWFGSFLLRVWLRFRLSCVSAGPDLSLFRGGGVDLARDSGVSGRPADCETVLLSGNTATL